MTRKLASIKTITHIRPIPGADAIECAFVGGWPVVVKKGEYQVDDVAIYLEIDSWVPHKLAPFLSKGKEPREYNGVKGERLQTVKLRGQVSQGLLLPIDEEPSEIGIPCYVLKTEHASYHFCETDDLTSFFGIQKWEPPIPAQLQGVMKGAFPHFIPKTDQERCQNLRAEIFEDHLGEMYEVTIKLDGSSTTIYVKDGKVNVCSRNLNLEETEGNSFWKAARDQGIIDPLLELCKNNNVEYALQGELIGEGIQGNPERLKGQVFYLFDVYNITEKRYLHHGERFQVLNQLRALGADIEHTPVVDVCFDLKNKFANIEDIVNFAEGPSLNPQIKREGVVFKSLSTPFTFKAISNSYLLKHKDR